MMNTNPKTFLWSLVILPIFLCARTAASSVEEVEDIVATSMIDNNTTPDEQPSRLLKKLKKKEGLFLRGGSNKESTAWKSTMKVPTLQDICPNPQWFQIGMAINGEDVGDQFGNNVAISSDGSILAISAYYHDGVNGSNRSGQVRVYERRNPSSGWVQIFSLDGEAAGDQFGYSLAISDDGTILAIGAKYSDNGIVLDVECQAQGIKISDGYSNGQVRVFKRSSASILGGWTQVGQAIKGDAYCTYNGRSVALSGSGDILAIGNRAVDDKQTGRVQIFRRAPLTTLGWEQLGEDIIGKGEHDLFGSSVALSKDGNIVAIGGWGNDENGIDSGHVRVYSKRNNVSTSDVWQQIGGDIQGESDFNFFGTAISLSDSGQFLAIGAYGNSDLNGHVRVYERNPISSLDEWTQVGGDIDSEGVGDKFGWSLSMSGDGSIIAIGATMNNGGATNSGHVRVYVRNPTSPIGWEPYGNDLEGQNSGDSFGYSVALSKSGHVLAVGAVGSKGNTGNATTGDVEVFQACANLG